MDRKKLPYTRGYATIDLDAVAYNMEQMKANLPKDIGMMAVVKADGYGHGAAPVAWAADPYVEMYGVASAEEALNLKHHGISKPILILGPIHHSHYETLIQEDIHIPVFTWSQAGGLSAKALYVGKPALIHLVVDTGMNRIGMRPDKASADMAGMIGRLPGIEVKGLFTHFARADEADKESALEQIRHYKEFLKMLEDGGTEIPIKHISNSAGIIDLPEICDEHFWTGQSRYLVRAGISMYGLYPSNQMSREKVCLKPAMELKSFITYIKEIGPGAAVSYGGTFVAKESMTVATVSIGYGDGYPRNQSGKGYVLIGGRRAAILGRVCMDQMIVDVSGIPDAREGDIVTLIGTEGDQQIQVEDLAETGGGFHYEIVCDIGKRIPRVYIKNGKVVGTKDYFQDVYQEFVRK